MSENDTTTLERKTKTVFNENNLQSDEKGDDFLKESRSDVDYSKQGKNEENSSTNGEIPTPISNHDDGYYTEGKVYVIFKFILTKKTSLIMKIFRNE